MTGRVYAVGSGTRFDERRNTSRVHPVPPGSGMAVARQLMRMRTEDWYRWTIAYGRQEHLQQLQAPRRIPSRVPKAGLQPRKDGEQLMPRRNRNAWRNDQARTDHQDGLHDLDKQRRRRRGKRGRRLEQQRRRAA